MIDNKELERIFRQHSRLSDERSLNAWLTYDTLCRYRDWVPSPRRGETRLLEVGCYQPSVGYYFHLGWKDVLGCFKEEGQCNKQFAYQDGEARASMTAVDAERERLRAADGWADAVIMMEVFEHFAIDPMHALWEANRVLKPGGRIVFSTPNATSFDSLIRIIQGRCPIGSLEFNGFSANRHNRIYDAREIAEILDQAGFRLETVTSRSYDLSVRGWKGKLLRRLVRSGDRIWQRGYGRPIERDSWLFVRAVKEGLPKERYPLNLYFDESQWPEWFAALRKGSGKAIAGPG